MQWQSNVAFAERVAGRSEQNWVSDPVVAPEREAGNCRRVFDALSQGICLFSADQRLVVCNTQYAQLYGLDPQTMVPGTTLAEIIDRRIAAGSFAGPSREAYRQTCLAAPPSSPQHVEHLPDGRSVLVKYLPLASGDWIASHEDVSDQQGQLKRVAYLATHDVLTDLSNRHVFVQQLEAALERGRLGEPFAVHWIDLDRFKSVNDSYGHAVGDLVLQDVAARLRSASRPTDIIARLGGDEFAILQYHAPDRASVEEFAIRLLATLDRPFVAPEHRFSVGGSIGIAVYDGMAQSAQAIMLQADHALYKAKEDGRCTFRFFDEKLERRVRLRNQVKIDLARAIVRDELELHYQPIVNLRNRRVVGFEALLRWNHPQRGRISPMDFIPVAEETGLILPIGDWVLKRACQDAARWPEHLRVAVNLSPLQFKNGRPSVSIERALAASSLQPHRLECEITESAIIQNVDATLAELIEIKSVGVRLSLDDFGTGYSSLSCLGRFPFDNLKIDRSFVMNLGTDPTALPLFRSITTLASALGMHTIVEGVETPEQLAIAAREGCAEAQGYLLKPPMPIGQALDCLTDIAKRTSEYLVSKQP